LRTKFYHFCGEVTATRAAQAQQQQQATHKAHYIGADLNSSISSSSNSVLGKRAAGDGENQVTGSALVLTDAARSSTRRIRSPAEKTSAAMKKKKKKEQKEQKEKKK
jgi:hypothetical protein